MKIRRIQSISARAALIGACSLGLASASCEQPDILCDVSSGPYAARYLPKDPESDCLLLPGELVGLKAYNPPSADRKDLDASKTSVAIQASSVGELTDNPAGAVDSDPTHTAYSLGDYSNKPGADDFCSAPSLSTAEQHIPETSYTDADGNAQVFPATRLAYEWKDLRIYTTFTAPGNAITGEVTITREVTDPVDGTKDSCTTTYVVSALNPTVACAAYDAMGQATGTPDDTQCCAEADPSKGRASGSGINPDYKVKCDPALLVCVLDWKPGEAFPPIGANPACGK